MEYLRIKQEPYCCVPACIQMILKRHGLPFASQEEIGIQLGLTVPKEKLHFFKNVKSEKEVDEEHGTKIQKEKYSLNSFFKTNNIPLIYEYCYFDDAEQAKAFLIENKSQDIIACFSYGTLWNTTHLGGHICLVEDIKDDTITLVDSEYTGVLGDVPRRETTIQKLCDAIKYHGKKNAAGFWLIKRQNA